MNTNGESSKYIVGKRAGGGIGRKESKTKGRNEQVNLWLWPAIEAAARVGKSGS